MPKFERVESSKKNEVPAGLMKICLRKETQIKALLGGKADMSLVCLVCWLGNTQSSKPLVACDPKWSWNMLPTPVGNDVM